MKHHLQTRVIALAAATLCSGAAQAITFEGETVSGNFDSTISLGVGVRAGKQACGLVIGSSGGSAAAATGPSAPAGCTDALSSLNDQGDLNYNRGDRFTTYLKGTHELLLNMPEDVKFLGRVSWLRDFSSTRTTGNISGANTTGNALSNDASNELHTKIRLLDLWVSESFDLGEERARNGGLCQTNGKCYIETEKYQLAVTGMLSLTPSEHGAVLKTLGADTATLMVEAVAIKYPNLKNAYGGIPVAAGLWGWGYDTTANASNTLANGGNTAGVGSATSYGYNFDFSWVYDGSVIPGWQVIPEVYFFHAVKGRTPNATATFMQGAKMANFTVTFTQNPAKWQVALNLAKFWGGASVLDQPLRDRSFYGMTISRNF